MSTKVCTACGREFPATGEYFHKNKSGRYGLHAWCKECKKADIKARHKEQQAADPDYYRRRDLRSRYGLTLEQFDALLASQGGCCAVCGTDTPGGSGVWHIDHDHSCCPDKKTCGNCVRGLLCYACNTKVMPVVENPDLLASAFTYLSATRKDAHVYAL